MVFYTSDVNIWNGNIKDPFGTFFLEILASFYGPGSYGPGPLGPYGPGPFIIWKKKRKITL